MEKQLLKLKNEFIFFHKCSLIKYFVDNQDFGDPFNWHWDYNQLVEEYINNQNRLIELGEDIDVNEFTRIVRYNFG